MEIQPTPFGVLRQVERPEYATESSRQLLRAAGYDIVLVGLDQGMDRIQRNADVLVACLREAMRRTDEPTAIAT